jgi:hypothetical protein
MLNILLNTSIEYHAWNDIDAWTGNSIWILLAIAGVVVLGVAYVLR